MKRQHGRRYVERLLDGRQFVAVDVGGRGDVPAHWIVLEGAAKFLVIEPDAEECSRLQRVFGSRGHGDSYTVIDSALSQEGGRLPFFLTNMRSGSSLLRPDAGNPIRIGYTERAEILPVTEIEVDTATLQSVLNRVGVSRIQIAKLDVQGAELAILKGLELPTVAGLVGIELEMSVNVLYQEQPTYTEVDAFLRENGFELFNINPARVHRRFTSSAEDITKNFGVFRPSATFAARLMEFDAVYFRRPCDVLSQASSDMVLQLAAAYCTYCYFGEAFCLLDDAATQGVLGADEAAGAKAAVIEWHRSRPLSRSRVDGFTMTLLRRIGAKVRVGGLRRWSQYQWRHYPSA